MLPRRPSRSRTASPGDKCMECIALLDTVNNTLHTFVVWKGSPGSPRPSRENGREPRGLPAWSPPVRAPRPYREHHGRFRSPTPTGLEFFSKLKCSEMLIMRLNTLGRPKESNMAALRRTRLTLTKVRGGSRCTHSVIITVCCEFHNKLRQLL